MQHQVSSKLFQRVLPLSMNITLPTPRLSTNPISAPLEKKAKSLAEIRTKYDEIQEQIAPNPLMHRPGEKNPLGEYSPYLPPLQIPGIRRAPRPMEEDPIPGSEELLKIRRPAPDGPYAEYRDDIGRWHSFIDQHVSSLLPGLYLALALFILFEPHNLTFKEFVTYLK